MLWIVLITVVVYCSIFSYRIEKTSVVKKVWRIRTAGSLAEKLWWIEVYLHREYYGNGENWYNSFQLWDLLVQKWSGHSLTKLTDSYTPRIRFLHCCSFNLEFFLHICHSCFCKLDASIMLLIICKNIVVLLYHTT